MSTKICSKCKIEKPISEFSKHRGRKDGYDNHCKQCVKEAKQTRLRNRQYIDIEIKVCIRCGEEKSIAEFTKNKISLDGFDYYCKDCKHIKENNYYIDNKFDRNKKVYGYHLKNFELTKETHNRFRLRNPEKIKKWDIDGKKKRKFKIKQSPYTLTDEEWRECLEFFNYQCAYCGKSENIQHDHFIPVAKYGSYTKDNMVVACGKCNASKGMKDFFEWYPKQDFYDPIKEEIVLKYLGYDCLMKKNNQIGVK